MTWAFFAERIQDAISNLESIRNYPDVSLCSIMALIYAHKRCETIGECSHAQPDLAPPEKESSAAQGLLTEVCALVTADAVGQRGVAAVPLPPLGGLKEDPMPGPN